MCKRDERHTIEDTYVFWVFLAFAYRSPPGTVFMLGIDYIIDIVASI